MIFYEYQHTNEAKILIERLRELRKTLKLNQTNFAKQLGMTQTAYSMIENGNNPLSDRHIKVICSSFNVNENWLRTGEGDRFFSSRKRIYRNIQQSGSGNPAVPSSYGKGAPEHPGKAAPS